MIYQYQLYTFVLLLLVSCIVVQIVETTLEKLFLINVAFNGRAVPGPYFRPIFLVRPANVGLGRSLGLWLDRVGLRPGRVLGRPCQYIYGECYKPDVPEQYVQVGHTPDGHVQYGQVGYRLDGGLFARERKQFNQMKTKFLTNNRIFLRRYNAN